MHEVEVQENGFTEYREIHCAEDRILIRAITQVLQPIFAQQMAPECVHLAGLGGTHQAVIDTHAQVKQQPHAFVMKSDVKGYYAHIDHFILHQQFCTLFPQEIELQRLLWQFMQRTIERSGNYREVTRGIPLGASISPLLAALYLSPLDALFTGNEKQFYRRYMDDWVIFCQNRWQLRNTVKQVYTVLHALRVEVAPDKTYIGKVNKGFDFLGKRILPIGILPSNAALSRLQKNTVRLYEQGASSKRIRQYWVRWLGWASLSALPLHSSADCVDFDYFSGDYGDTSCGCYQSIPPNNASKAAAWDVSFDLNDGHFIVDDPFQSSICASIYDTTCNESLPPTVTTGTTLYIKNTSGSDYYKCTITLGSKMLAETYTPLPPPPGNPPVAAPLPLGFAVTSAFGLGLVGIVAYRRRRNLRS